MGDIFLTCTFGLPERGTDNSTECVHRMHTRSVHHEHYNLLTSTDHICACGSRPSRLKHELQRHLCAHEKSLSSGQPCHFLAGLCHTFSLPVHHNTKHHLDSTTFSKTTLYTEHLFRNLYSQQAVLKSRSRTSITSGGNPRNTSPTGYEPKPLAAISGSSLEDICQFYDVQREFGEEDQQASMIEEVKEFGQIGTQTFSITRWQRYHLLRRCPTSSPRCTSTSLWKALRTLILKMESYKSC